MIWCGCYLKYGTRWLIKHGWREDGAMRYIPNTEQDIKHMLKEIGADSIDDLFLQINNDLILKGDLELPEPLSEQDLSLHLKN